MLVQKPLHTILDTNPITENEGELVLYHERSLELVLLNDMKLTEL